MAIVNATIPIAGSEVPILLDVQPAGGTSTTQPTGGLDFNGLTGLVTAIGGILGAIGFKMFRDKKQEDFRSNIMAETSLLQTKSLQETDKADYEFRAAVVDFITSPTDESKKQKLIELAQESKQNYKAYYENIQPQPLDYDKDPVIRKLSAVQKRTSPE